MILKKYIILLLFIALSTSVYSKERGPLTYTQEILPPTEQWAVDLIYEGLEAIDDICRKNNLEYVLTGGSLLGSYWYNGLIPWDDDADISMLEEDVKKLLLLAPELEEKGFQIMESEWGYYIYPTNGVPTKKGQKYPAIDLFPLKKRGGKYCAASERCYNHWPNEYFTQEEWHNITDITFGHLTLRGHAGMDAERMLNTTYGDDWKYVVEAWWDHKNECPREKIVAALTDRSHTRHSKFQL